MGDMEAKQGARAANVDWLYTHPTSTTRVKVTPLLSSSSVLSAEGSAGARGAPSRRTRHPGGRGLRRDRGRVRRIPRRVPARAARVVSGRRGGKCMYRVRVYSLHCK
jgi:hypothetical protein